MCMCNTHNHFINGKKYAGPTAKEKKSKSGIKTESTQQKKPLIQPGGQVSFLFPKIWK